MTEGNLLAVTSLKQSLKPDGWSNRTIDGCRYPTLGSVQPDREVDRLWRTVKRFIAVATELPGTDRRRVE
jgi:hypothetical protein